MGKGTIKSGGTDGLYTIDIVRDTSAMQTRLAALQQRAIDIQDEIAAAAAARTEAKNELDAAVAALSALIDLWAESQDNDDAVNAQAEVVTEKAKTFKEADRAHAALILDAASIEKQIQGLESVEALIETAAWCADFTEDLTGDVGTVEIPGERQRLLLRPGHEGAAVYDPARDGQLQPTQSSGPATVAWNYAMLPGWQRWIPQYRAGTITAIDAEANTCTVTLFDDRSSAQNLGVNHFTWSADIPIEYMTCHHEAFEVGDEVIIEFENVTKTGTADNWGNPKVIGFLDNPKECPATYGFRIQPNPGCESADPGSCWNGWGAPFESGDPPVPINPPWGTEGSASQSQSLVVKDNGSWVHWRDPQTATWNNATGTIDWQGAAGMITWDGGEQGSRYRLHEPGQVYYKGEQVPGITRCTGACVRDFNGGKYLVVAEDNLSSVSVSTFNADTLALEWTTNETMPAGTGLNWWNNTGSYWLFNSAGTRAVAIREYSGEDPYASHADCSIPLPIWRRKVYMDISLRVGGGGQIIADVAFVDASDEMPVVDEPAEDYTFHTASRGTVAVMPGCSGGLGGVGANIYIQGLLENEYWNRSNASNFSYKIYDFKGNSEVSAELWNTREWEATHGEGPAPVSLVGRDPCPVDEAPAQRRSGTYDFYPTYGTYQNYPVWSSGSSTVRCGVRFTGTGMPDIEHEAFDTFTGTGVGQSYILSEDGYENRPSFGNTFDTTCVRNNTRLLLAIPYMDLRCGQIVTVLEERVQNYSDRHWYEFGDGGASQTEHWAQSGTETNTITITAKGSGATLETERSDSAPIPPENPLFHEFAPYLKLAQKPFRPCRGRETSSSSYDYLFVGTQKEPRPMAASAGSTCASYVDRWVMNGEGDATNPAVPPIRSVLNNFPVALSIPGTHGNAAPVMMVEPSS